MFDTTLIASNPRREANRKLATLPAALAVHAMALGFVMVGQLWAVQPVEQPDVVVAFVDSPPPSPPPAPPKPPEGHDATATKPADPKPPADLVQPTVIPSQPATAGPPEPTGRPDGVEGGDDDGREDGIPGSATLVKTEEPPPVRVDDTPVRPGAGIVLPVNIFRSEPVYPELARRAHLQGVVIVEATIDRQGNVVDTRVLRDLGLGCGDAVVEALRSWKYRPATRYDRPVSIIVTVTVTFKLAGSE
jgi:protein TonB